MADRKFINIRSCKVGTVPLSIMEYSYCIRDAFIKLLPDIFGYKKQFKRIEKYKVYIGHNTDALFRNKRPMALMTLCVSMALFIQSPNHSYHTHIGHIQQSLQKSINIHYGSSVFRCSESLIQHVCQCIEEYLISKTRYKWQYSADDQKSNAQYELYEDNAICSTTKMMINDAVCVALSPNIDLQSADIICFQIYCIAKNDEMWIGICNENNFGDDEEERATNNRITYYGGRKGSNDKSDHWDGKYGAIHGMKQLMQTHLEEYGQGDWITIIIDAFKHKITFFKNNRFQSAIIYKKYSNELGQNTVFYALLDDIFDALFIEQTMYFGSVWKKVYSGK